MNATLSRRSFLQGAGVAAAGIAAAGALTASADQAQALDQVTAETPEWLGTAPEIDEADITETVDTEVLVCGFGTGGVPCALSAAESGSKVLVIERDAEDTAQEMREDLGAINSTLQQESFTDYPQFEISEKDAVEDIVRYANGYCNYDLIKLWAERSGEAIDWVTSTIEATGKAYMEFEGGIGNPDGGGRDRAYATGHSPHLNENAGEDESYTSIMRDAAVAALSLIHISEPTRP